MNRLRSPASSLSLLAISCLWLLDSIFKANKMIRPSKYFLVWIRQPRFWRIIAVLLPAITLMPFCLIELFVKLPQAVKEQRRLEYELRLLSPPAEASLIEHYASHKTSQADAMESYSLDWTADQVFTYYDGVLTQNGWRFSKQYGSTYGAIGRRYCKDNYTATVEYDESAHKWRYGVWLDWGLTSECYLEGRPLIPSWICIAFPFSLIASLIVALFLRRNYSGR